MTCWHCSDTGVCSCPFCEGKACQVCAGRARMVKELELAAKYRLDVRNSLDYEVAHTGAHYYRKLRFPKGITA